MPLLPNKTELEVNNATLCLYLDMPVGFLEKRQLYSGSASNLVGHSKEDDDLESDGLTKESLNKILDQIPHNGLYNKEHELAFAGSLHNLALNAINEGMTCLVYKDHQFMTDNRPDQKGVIAYVYAWGYKPVRIADK